jgi:hypothetical protein
MLWVPGTVGKITMIQERDHNSKVGGVALKEKKQAMIVNQGDFNIELEVVGID